MYEAKRAERPYARADGEAARCGRVAPRKIRAPCPDTKKAAEASAAFQNFPRYANLARRAVYISFSAASRQMAMDLEVPSRSAPASIIARAAAASRMPPEALTFTAALTESLIRRTSSTVAPPVEKPVEVFTNFAPAASAMRQAAIFS